MKDLEKELPEVDRFYGKFNWKELISDLGKSYHQELATERVLTTPRHYAYVKIGEGCNRTCSYCSIPIITGAYQSRPMDEIVDEVRGLVAQGVKEFQMIAQDLTFYGLDRYKRMALPELVERVSDIPGVEWIRLHYGYPSHFPYDLLPVMRERDNVCKYMDIALQHISDPMLKMMRRNITKAETYELLERMRREEGISADVNASKVGQTFRVIVDREEEDFYVGRTQYDSPEVDPEILISKDTPLSPGSFYQVKVIDAQAFDLYGKVLN